MQKLILLALSMCLAVNIGYAEVKKGNPKKAKGTKAAASAPAKAKVQGLVLADFDSAATTNNVGGKFGAWDKDPNDDTQGCKAASATPGYDEKGKCIKLTYDVDSPNPAYNGFWMKLEGADATPYGKLTFYIKGDANEAYTTRLKVEIKDDKGASPYYVTEVSDKWQKVEIPFSEFGLISNWDKMQEFVLVFEDGQATEKAGVIYIDNVAFEK